MTLTSLIIGRSRCAIAGAAIAILLAGAWFSPASAAAATGGPPPGQGRIWVYRDFQPYVSLARPHVRFNGHVVAISEPGGAFYRNVPPGRYEITVDSRGRDVNQFARVTVAAGDEIFVEVDVLRNANCGFRSRGGACPPIFYTLLRPPRVAASAIANSTFHGGK